MKKKLLLVMIVCTTLCTQAQTKTWQSLVGKWQAVDADNKSAGLEVVDSTHMYLVYGDQKKQVINYKVDFTKSPATFDFAVKDSTQTFNISSVLQFVNDDLVEWQIFEGTQRPVHFTSDAGDLLYLRRQK